MNRNIEAEKIMLTDVPVKLRNVRKVARNVPYELHDFTDYLASVADECLNPAGMINLLICGLADIDSGKCGYKNRPPIPKKLLDERYQILAYISFFPLIVDKIASKDFAQEFRKLFEDIMDCKAKPQNFNF